MDDKSRQNISEAFASHPKVFQPNEKIYLRDNTMYFTSLRLLNLTIWGKIKDEVPIENVLSLSTGKLGRLLVESKDGNSAIFSITNEKKFLEFQRILKMIQAGEEPEGVIREDPPVYGTLVANESFGNYRVRIFSDGYVQISKGLGLIQGSTEKLLQIEGDAQISKKTGLGRGLATIVTAGANQLSPNQRGNLILTVTTDKEVHVLIQDMPFENDIKSMQKLAAAGKSVINKSALSATATVQSTSPNQSLAQQIRELSELKDSGVISEKEFESAKRKLLS
jgi:hypothetical protein